MAERPETSREDADLRSSGAAMTAADLDAWFAREVLPLEAALMQFLSHNWRNRGDVADLRQDVYVRVYEAAQKKIPVPAKPFVFAIARNLMIDRLRHERIIPIEAGVDIDALDIAVDEPGPDRSVIAREELRHLQAAIDRLPPRCREVVVKKRIEGLSRHEIAAQMGITPDTVSAHLTDGMCALADMLYGNRRQG
ncbi:MAG TPA: sigma-70 family RNA polymerase sigma factor [Rhizomicrobium sp.]|nr:sigma-70 family RNA polymerase sigma factor [Rhizomicrobium sp.]